MVELSGVTGNYDLWKWFIRQKDDMHDFFKRWKGLSKHSFKNLKNMTLIQISSKDTPCVCLQFCPTLYDPMDYSSPDSSVHGLSQAIILEWVAMPSSGGSSQSRDQTCVSCVSCIGRQVLYVQRHLGSPLHLGPIHILTMSLMQLIVTSS